MNMKFVISFAELGTMVKEGTIGIFILVVLAVVSVNSIPVHKGPRSVHAPRSVFTERDIESTVNEIKRDLEELEKRGLLSLGRNLVGGAARLGANVLNTGLNVGAGLADSVANLGENLIHTGANFAQNLAGTGSGFLRNAAQGAKDLAENAVGTANSVFTKRQIESTVNEMK